ncbi:SLAIN motif-containing protein-like [Thunnus albacares]|uniref:SLAIN motif-containing protein-like n=1 Tax=Thunnus albacares TaxID=8236 RepID=UPI001CF63F84|nr:SLAIN motif-containing protein-like [Thunnus albacares]
MELQDQVRSDWGHYFCNQPPVEFGTSANHHLFHGELLSSSVRSEGNSALIWTDTEPTRVKSCNGRSFAMDARIRLDHLKSRSNSPSPCCSMDGTLYNYQKDLWDGEMQEMQSVLDSVELLDLEDNVEDEESWLYEPPKKQEFAERSESALRWCRHVLDNPSPQMEAARHLLMNRLDQKSSTSSSHRLYRCPAVFDQTGNASGGSSMGKTSVNTHNNSDSLDNNELSISNDFITTSYRLQDITDVHIMARIQEASLRQDYVSTPAATSPRNPESQVKKKVDVDDFTPGNTTESSFSSCWQPRLSSPCQSPAPSAKQSCQSPKLARLHQQVTQFKLLKLAQNKASPPGRTRSPLRTSLRSLQAVRNSRSLDTDDCHPDDQITYPPPGESSARMGMSCWSSSPSAASMSSNVSLHSVRDSSVRLTAIKKLQRSQSLSPSRIPHRGHLSSHGRVFATHLLPQATTVAWGRDMPFTQR